MGRAFPAGAALLALVLAGAASAQPAAGDAAKGKTAFAMCSACHALTGPSIAGPRLGGVVGRKAGTAAGFRYSAALAASGITWTEQTLDGYLANPSKTVPGTSMVISVPNAQQRADLIAYLKTLPAP